MEIRAELPTSELHLDTRRHQHEHVATRLPPVALVGPGVTPFSTFEFLTDRSFR